MDPPWHDLRNVTRPAGAPPGPSLLVVATGFAVLGGFLVVLLGQLIVGVAADPSTSGWTVVGLATLFTGYGVILLAGPVAIRYGPQPAAVQARPDGLSIRYRSGREFRIAWAAVRGKAQLLETSWGGKAPVPQFSLGIRNLSSLDLLLLRGWDPRRVLSLELSKEAFDAILAAWSGVGVVDRQRIANPRDPGRHVDIYRLPRGPAAPAKRGAT